jgi:hypothetical protein
LWRGQYTAPFALAASLLVHQQAIFFGPLLFRNLVDSSKGKTSASHSPCEKVKKCSVEEKKWIAIFLLERDFREISLMSELEAVLGAESILPRNLRAKGYQLYLKPAAKAFHINFSSALSSIALRFCVGRLFASTRSGDWSSLRRFFYFAGSPLIPLIRLLRILRELRRPGRPQELLPRILPSLVIGLVLDGIEEMIGYAFGMGNVVEKLSDMEFHRDRHLNRRDRELNLTHSNIRS